MEIKNFNITVSNLPYLFAKITALDMGEGYVANITVKQASRSTDQNSRLWKLYNALGNHIGHSGDDMHRLMGYKFLRYQERINDEVVELIRSTTKLDMQEMSKYQGQIEHWANDIGFVFNE